MFFFCSLLLSSFTLQFSALTFPHPAPAPESFLATLTCAPPPPRSSSLLCASLPAFSLHAPPISLPPASPLPLSPLPLPFFFTLPPRPPLSFLFLLQCLPLPLLLLAYPTTLPAIIPSSRHPAFPLITPTPPASSTADKGHQATSGTSIPFHLYLLPHPPTSPASLPSSPSFPLPLLTLSLPRPLSQQPHPQTLQFT